MISNKIIICSDCEGHGITYGKKLIDYHKRDYQHYTQDCNKCNNRGVVMQTTKVTTRPLKEKEYKPYRNHREQKTSK